MDTLTALKENGPWIGMGDLVKVTGKDAASLRDELKQLLDAGDVQKAGKKRGTKYALSSVESPDPQDSVDYKEEIRKALLEAKTKVSRKELCETIGTYDAKIRPSLLEMVDDGEVCHNNKKKGQLFWLAEHEAQGLIEEEPEPEAAPVKREPVAEEDKPEIRSLEELVRLGVSMLRPGEKFSMLVDELKEHINTCARHSFESAQIFETFSRMLKTGLLPRMRYESRYESGYRIHYWVEKIA